MKVKAMDSKNQVLHGNTTSCSDQQIMEDFPLEDIMKEYFCEEELQSFYSDVFDIDAFGDLSLPNIVPDDVNAAEMNADFLVPDSLFLDQFCQKYDDTEPEEQLFSLLEEYIQEEEDSERKGKMALESEVACSSADSVSYQTNQPDVIDSLVYKDITAEQRKTKKPRKRHRKRSRELSHVEQSGATTKERRKETMLGGIPSTRQSSSHQTKHH